VKKRRGELSPEQQQVVREIALEVETRHETAAAEAEAFLKQRRDVEAENLAAGQAVLAADLEAKRELAAALQAEAEAAGLEPAREEAEDIATFLEGQLVDARDTFQDLKSEFDGLADEKADAEKRLAENRGKLARVSGQSKEARRRRNKLRSAIEAEQGRILAATDKQKAVENEAKALNDSAKKMASAANENREIIDNIRLEQQNAFTDRLISEASVAAAAGDLSGFVPAPEPVRRPQTRSQTRRQQKTAELSRAVTRSMARALPAERKFEAPVQAVGRPIDILKQVADSLGASYRPNANRSQVLSAIGRRNPEEARRYALLGLDIA
jgi:chromosome segregation ATPase